ncbi:MAG: uroporphyrinogen decarboxylase family protein [candidate division KSB1 bacterium]|nr:uroporphyrinogen decarboxylase family protein [candidate division KSB1 bacterium]MDZ7275810.1 uroporphyrinogen decarboxylase family protein [candidate division KSB1 bacterium]MDZ7287561.1 uroporphyrinogen decarboxylase family protein [candidate division KSB1 bacterium]MDZ7308035.1 uroporphyrinogen decarboxylase family protein [candidate division KSB1 bacterium]MDZ7350539.1 uroporphyrinogen decarboxylase family protein [candidate division KSB1 bacterium]
MPTPLERLLAAISHKESDRIPILPILLQQGAKELGMPLQEYFTNGEKLAEGQERLLEKYGHDGVIGVPHVVEDLLAFGQKLVYFPNGAPVLGSMAITRFHEIDSLRPHDPTEVPELRQTLLAIELLARRFKGKVPIFGAGIAPFSLPSMFIGTEKWLQLLFDDEQMRLQYLDKFLAVSMEFCVNWMNRQLAAGADAVIIADGMASATILLRKQFQDWAVPVIKQTISRINGPVVYEGVGSLGQFAELLPELGAVAVVLDRTDDLAACKKVLQGKVAMVGNLNNIAMIDWTPEEIEQQVKTACLAAKAGGGFILANQGPEMPYDVPDANIQAFVEAGKRWGKQ